MGNDNVNELYEYKNLGVVKNYIGSFSSNVEENIDKKAGMLFSVNFDRPKVNPLAYIKLWRQTFFAIRYRVVYDNSDFIRKV